MTHPSGERVRRAPTPGVENPGTRCFALRALLVALFLSAWPFSFALSQEEPGEARIRAAIVLELPPWWSVRSVDVQASINDGDTVKPRWRHRFLAEVEPAEELFVRAPNDYAVAPFRVLIPTRGVAEPFTLYGVANSRLERGEWRTTLALENSVTDVGRPSSFFGGLVVVAGSEKAEHVAASLERAGKLVNTVTEIRMRFAADADVLRQLSTETAAALETVNRRRQETLQTRYEAERLAILAAAETERALLEEENRSRLESLKASLAEESAQIEMMAAAAEAERADLIAGNQASLDALRAQFEAERVALEAANAAERAAMEEAIRLALEAQKTSLLEESASVESEAADMEAERMRLIAEIEESLSALQATHYRERAAVEAAGEVLVRVSEAEVETAAHRELVAAMATLATEKQREAEIAAEVAGAELAARTARYDALIEWLGSDVDSRRYAAFDLAVASDDDGMKLKAIESALVSGDRLSGARAFDLVLASDDSNLKLRAFDLALASNDARLKRLAVDMAVSSESENLKARAVAQLPRITQWAARVEAFSSRYGGESNKEIIGPPKNHQCSTRQNPPAWYFRNRDDGMQWVTVSFRQPVMFPQVVVHETGRDRNSVGFVREIVLHDEDDGRTRYPVRDRLGECPGPSKFDLFEHPRPVYEVSIIVDTQHQRGGREGIDAVAIIGTPLEQDSDQAHSTGESNNVREGRS